MPKRLLIIFSAALIMCCACQRKPPNSTGDEKGIIVIADSSDFVFLREELARTFEREILTPWPEKIFALKQIPVAQMRNHILHPRLLLIGILDSATPAAEKVKAMLTPEIEARIRRGENYVFKKDDPWAKDQTLLVLSAVQRDTLRHRIAAHRDELFEWFNQPLNEATQRVMFSQFEQRELGKSLRRQYNWAVRIQHDYHLYKNLPGENFVMLRRSYPERWLMVSWQNAATAKKLTPEAVVQWRNLLGKKFAEQDKVVENSLKMCEIEFAGYRAQEVQGLWENERQVAGGPFKTWVFYDENWRRLFLVDIAVFAPGKEKIKYLRQLEIMARTFQAQPQNRENVK